MESPRNNNPASDRTSSEAPQPFFHLDLAKFTAIGWLLMALTLIAMFATIFAAKAISESLGWRPDRYLLGFCGLAAGGAVFEGGRRLLLRAGFRVSRPD